MRDDKDPCHDGKPDQSQQQMWWALWHMPPCPVQDHVVIAQGNEGRTQGDHTGMPQT